ncbi:T9SS type A sorting domain-containing protein [Pontibacter sp. MBLB2868]|uniref:T9SS type A sorting domain-containing protein n=1 Tax=Pontibacter sp. MBLB2868 TaxID=3451555 RepID=UPI003F7564FB
MKQILLTLYSIGLLLPLLAFGEGSKQLTPYTTSAATTDKENTTVGYLQHDDNGNQTISFGFLKPNTWSVTGASFIEDYRMYVRLKPGETVYYGVRRRVTNANVLQNDLILTLKYGSGAGTVVQTTTLVRDQTSVNHSTLLPTIGNGKGTPQYGVIATPLEAQNGPNYGVRTNGYNALAYTNTTGVTNDFYLEFTQVGEAAMLADQKKSWYDLWDLTVVGTDRLEKPGRLFSKQWSFTAGASSNVLSKTFAFYPLIPNQLDGTTYYVKKITLAGMRPFGFRFVTNQFGSSSKYGTTFQERRKSQLEQSDYSEYLNFVNNPDPEMWPSAPDPNFSFTASTICDGAQPTIEFTSNAGVPSTFMVLIDVNGDGYKTNTADVKIENTFAAGINKLTWNGRDSYGNIVPSGTTLNYSYKSYTSPMNFPVFDAEGNASGFKSENVRPVPSTVNDLLYWDDSKLPVSKFPLATQQELNGINANTGAHLWGATADNGDGYTVNTWTYGYTYTKNETLVFTYDCSLDLEVTNTVPQITYFEGDYAFFTVTVKNNGPTAAKYVLIDYPVYEGFTFVSASPAVGTYNSSTGKWTLSVPLAVGESQVMTFKAIATTVGTWPTTAVVSSDQIDTNSANNTSTTSLKVSPLPSPMPVTMSSFNASSDTRGVKLEWLTAMELNNDYFAVERSTDGRNFTEIGRVPGKGNSQQYIRYNFLDTKAPTGVLYYRLKQVDKDATQHFSIIRSVQVLAKNTTSAKLKVYPNPAKDFVNLDLTMLAQGLYDLSVFDTYARCIMQLNHVEGGSESVLDIQSLPAGAYFIRIQGNNHEQVVQLLKQ